jgi:hypothetical protein
MRTMNPIRSICLVTNAASGSNEEQALEALERSFGTAGLRIVRKIRFPDEPLPSIRMLDAAGIDCVAVFAGDGTVNSLVTSLYGWGGAVLVLPGGTMNLLFHRLHGDREAADVLAAVGAGKAQRRRPDIIRCDNGDGLSGVMAGPGTEWNRVREALRNIDIAGVAAGTVQAIGKSVAAPMIACRDPALGRAEGYPLIMLTPEQGGFVVDAYYAETLEEYLAQGLALLRRDFREGPHETIGTVAELTIRNVSGEPVGLLVDGEPADAGPYIRFVLAPCEVDLLATEADD